MCMHVPSQALRSSWLSPSCQTRSWNMRSTRTAWRAVRLVSNPPSAPAFPTKTHDLEWNCTPVDVKKNTDLPVIAVSVEWQSIQDLPRLESPLFRWGRPSLDWCPENRESLLLPHPLHCFGYLRTLCERAVSKHRQQAINTLNAADQVGGFVHTSPPIEDSGFTNRKWFRVAVISCIPEAAG